MLGERFVVMPVECPRCKTKQKIHVAVRAGAAQVGDQTIPCIQCDNDFEVKVPDRIVGGPFPYSLAISFL
jgi:transcription elongation factor Elf1